MRAERTQLADLFYSRSTSSLVLRHLSSPTRRVALDPDSFLPPNRQVWHRDPCTGISDSAFLPYPIKEARCLTRAVVELALSQNSSQSIVASPYLCSSMADSRKSSESAIGGYGQTGLGGPSLKPLTRLQITCLCLSIRSAMQRNVAYEAIKGQRRRIQGRFGHLLYITSSLQYPIQTHDGSTLCGRNRYRASVLAPMSMRANTRDDESMQLAAPRSRDAVRLILGSDDEGDEEEGRSGQQRNSLLSGRRVRIA